MTTRRFLCLLFASFPLAAMAGGSKNPGGEVTFHIQAGEGENPKMTFPQLTNGKQVLFRRMSDFSTRDIANFNATPSQDGEGYAAVFILKPGAISRLAAVTTDNPGKWMLAMVNGRVVDAVLIDKPVKDGQLVIWKNISEAEIAEFDKKIPRLGQSKPKS